MDSQVKRSQLYTDSNQTEDTDCLGLTFLNAYCLGMLLHHRPILRVNLQQSAQCQLILLVSFFAKFSNFPGDKEFSADKIKVFCNC